MKDLAAEILCILNVEKVTISRRIENNKNIIDRNKVTHHELKEGKM